MAYQMTRRISSFKSEKSGGHRQGGIYGTQQPQTAVTNNEERKVFIMANQIFMRVNEVAEELGVSVPYAYKLIRHHLRMLCSFLRNYYICVH